MRAVGATVTGRRHVARGAQCEDAVAIRQRDKGAWTAAVLCDGCGSAKYAEAGARFISEVLADLLLDLSSQISRQGPGEWVIDSVICAIANLRTEMRARFGDRIEDYAATIVATLVSRQGGFLLHIGDGIATALAPSEHGATTWRVLAQSEPKNGEFVNQTFYPTEPNWIHNVWITPVKNPGLIVLCSDGAQEIAYRGNNIDFEKARSFIERIREAPGREDEALGASISEMDTQEASGDDLGIILVFDELSISTMQHLSPLDPTDVKRNRGSNSPNEVSPSSDLESCANIKFGPLARAGIQVEIAVAQAWKYKHLMLWVFAIISGLSIIVYATSVLGEYVTHFFAGKIGRDNLRPSISTGVAIPSGSDSNSMAPSLGATDPVVVIIDPGPLPNRVTDHIEIPRDHAEDQISAPEVLTSPEHDGKKFDSIPPNSIAIPVNRPGDQEGSSR
jgi:hypothetical protein